MKVTPIHPGRVLQVAFMEPLDIEAYTLAKALDMPRSTVEAVVCGTRSLSADMAPRLSRVFGNSANYWVNLQAHYDLEVAKDKVGDSLDGLRKIVA